MGAVGVLDPQSQNYGPLARLSGKFQLGSFRADHGLNRPLRSLFVPQLFKRYFQKFWHQVTHLWRLRLSGALENEQDSVQPALLVRYFSFTENARSTFPGIPPHWP